MGINIRTKGAEGEREVVKLLEPLVQAALAEAGWDLGDKPVIQRNQNQSAVGGKDLTNTFGLAIEIKRQEQLSVNTWWAQCVRSAQALDEVPVLMYRQNGKRWRVRTLVWLQAAQGDAYKRGVGELELEEFLDWFSLHVKARIKAGYLPMRDG